MGIKNLPSENNFTKNSTTLYTFTKDEVKTLKYWADMYKNELYQKTGGLLELDSNLYHKLNCITKNKWNEFLQEVK